MLRVRMGRQTLDHFGEVALLVEAPDFAVLDQGVEQGVVHSGFGAAEEQIVLGSQLGGANRVFDQVVVELKFAVVQAKGELVPLPKGILQRFPKVALGKVFGSLLEDSLMKGFYNGSAARQAHELAAIGRCLGFAQLSFDPVARKSQREKTLGVANS